MPTVEESVFIDRPVAEVFDFAIAPDNQTLINSSMIEYEADGEPQKGQHAKGVTRVAGRKLPWSSETVDFVPNQRVVIKSVEAPMSFEISYDFTEQDDGTLVTFHQETAELGGFFGKLGDAVVTKLYARDVKGNLENLKTLVEEG